MGLELEAVEMIVSPEATLAARFCSSGWFLFGDVKCERIFCIALGSTFPFLSLVPLAPSLP